MGPPAVPKETLVTKMPVAGVGLGDVLAKNAARKVLVGVGLLIVRFTFTEVVLGGPLVRLATV